MNLLKLAPYSPDNAILSGVYSAYLKNVFIGQNSYIPCPSLEKITSIAQKNICGAIAFTDFLGKVKIFIGTDKELLILDSEGWKNVSAPNITYNASREISWSFALFGTYVVAVNANDDAQIFEVGHSNNFRKLGGKPPRASKVKVWGDFLCLMGHPDNPNRVFWSGLNDIEFWTPGKKSCDYQDFPEGGVVQNSSQDANPLIFLKNAIYYGQFLPGSDLIFSFKKLYSGQGAKFPGSIVGSGQNIFYVDSKGFFQIDATGANIPIGDGYIDKTIFEKITNSDKAVIANMEAAIDPYTSRVYWAMDYNGSGLFTEILVYDWQLRAWSRIELDINWLVPIYSLGFTLESLDKVCENINNFPYSFDDAKWKGGYPLLAAFDKEGYLCSFTGGAMECVIESQELNMQDYSMQILEYVQPIIDTNNFSVSIGKRQNFKQKVQWSSEYKSSSKTGNVVAYMRSRFFRFRINIKQGVEWTHMRGFETALRLSGKQ